MKQTIAILCLIGASLSGFSQDKSFDLSKYKFPDYKRHELNFNFNSNGSQYKNSYDEPSNNGTGNIVRNANSYYSSHSNFSLGYQYDYLTRSRIDQLHASLSGQYDFTKVQSSAENTKQMDPNLSLNFGGSRKYYLTKDKLFLEVAPDLGYNISEIKRTTGGIVDTNNKSNSFTALIDLGVGIGRMEKVSDLWQSYYILEKLKEQKSLVRELDEKDIFEFASLASKLKNKRFFDARLQKIAELQALDSLLNKQGLIEGSDISYFTTLNDYWSFAYFRDRESGRIVKFWLSPQYSRYSYKSVGTSSQITTNTNLVSNLSFNCTKQLNLFWDRHLNILLSNETLIDKTGSNSDNYPKNLFHTDVNFGFDFFPNSRTSVSASVGYGGSEGVYQAYTETFTKQWSNRIYFNVDGVYYISPQLQITGNYRIGYSDKIYNAFNTTIMNYNLGLRYAIF